MFIIGTVGIGMFGNSTIGFLLLITHILACLTVGFLFRFWKSSENRYKKKSRTSSYDASSVPSGVVTFSNLGETIATSISNATSTILMIGGFVVMFSVIISILNTSNFLHILGKLITPLFGFLHLPTLFIPPLLTGILEITNGIALIANIHIKAISINIILTAFLLGIGGISILLQVLSITSKTDLSIKPYIIGKILQGFISAFYTWLFLHIFTIFNFNL